jgi:PhnB protein
MTVQQHTATVQPYIFFDGKCEEALEFYKGAIGAKVEMLMRFKENPDQPDPSHMPPNSGDKVMHASLTIGDAILMVSDGSVSGKPNFQGISLSLTVPSGADADRMFNALAKGGNVQLPMGKTFFSPRFGMVADKFGVPWMIMAASEGA